MGNHNGTIGWRVLATDPRGPCRECKLVPFFDYITGINGRRLDEKAATLTGELESHRNKQIELTILNYKTMKTRTIEVCPCGDWGGIGMLGLMIANDCWDTADERVIRVLSVFPQSPAEAAGLHPFVDYIMGTDNCIFQGLDAFEDFVLKHVDLEIRLRVYNSNICQVREVRITATTNWSQASDQGILGCEVGSGLLHKIPAVLPETVITAHETSFSDFEFVLSPGNRGSSLQENPILSTDIGIEVSLGDVHETLPVVCQENNVPVSNSPPAELSSAAIVKPVAEVAEPKPLTDASTSVPGDPVSEENPLTAGLGGSLSGGDKALPTPEESKRLI